MKCIYQTAKRVSVWTGENDEHTMGAIVALRKPDERRDPHAKMSLQIRKYSEAILTGLDFG
jgi:hypothetical protein